MPTREHHRQTVRPNLGTVTRQRVNGPAEYRTLSAALQDLTGCIQRAGKVSSACGILVHTGSQLLVGPLTQGGQLHWLWQWFPGTRLAKASAKVLDATYKTGLVLSTPFVLDSPVQQWQERAN